MNNYTNIIIKDNSICNKSMKLDSNILDYIQNKKNGDIIRIKIAKHNLLRKKIIDWLLIDMGDNLINLDFLKISFDIILNNLNVTFTRYKYKKWFYSIL